MNGSTRPTALLALAVLLFGLDPNAWAAIGTEEYPTRFSNQRSIANTRHNLTQRQATGGPFGVIMDPYRNDYAEVCVYCHTPHGANSNVTLPLWNRTIKSTTYTTFAAFEGRTGEQPITQPGSSSLSCLSCHDGQVAIDSVINMPGSGGYNPTLATTPNNTLLNAWSNPSGVPGGTKGHLGLDPVANQGCLVCHSANAGVVGAGASDFSVFVIGTDLRNDHPIGVRYPTPGPGVDFKPTTGSRQGIRWFDTDSNSFPDSREIRLYDSGEGHEVECASCHDPHGVDSGGAGSTFIPSFLRVANVGSAVCLTCHVK